MKKSEVIAKLQSFANPVNVAGMARYGINPKNTLGISIYILREIAKEIGRDDGLADELWVSGIHEARILASYIADPDKTTEERMDNWAVDFDSWDVCDQVSGFLKKRHLLIKRRSIGVRAMKNSSSARLLRSWQV